MPNVISQISAQLPQATLPGPIQAAGNTLRGLIEANAYVGEVVALGYSEAILQIHDFHRQQVGGIPALCFLLATRVNPETVPDTRLEDASVILLRVMDNADLPNAEEAKRVRVENAQRVSGEVSVNWDDRTVMDATTHNLLSYAGVRCRVIGTFYMNELGTDSDPDWKMCFGSDISNYYPNRGLKVYKPRGEVLGHIVNFRDPLIFAGVRIPLVQIGQVRYASTNRRFQQIASVPVSITPTDLLGQKTALFGMTRTGKSNTTKIILKAIFALRWAASDAQRIGQLVFDPNGEYANENTQDADTKNDNPNAIKNVWKSAPTADRSGFQKDVVTYGITKHPNDPDRVLMLLNFYQDQNLQTGKEIINAALAERSSGRIYISNFIDVNFQLPEDADEGDKVRFQRRILLYRGLLHEAGFGKPPQKEARLKGLFNEGLRNGEAFGLIMTTWERLLLIHLLRCFEQRNWLDRLNNIAFFLDGPLAVFGPPAWLSAAISGELQRLNTLVRSQTGNDLIIVGIEKSGNFVAHFDEIDKREDGGQYFPPGSYFLPTDDYIKQRVIFSDSTKRYGADTYFGRKFFYKTQSGARIVANIAFLTAGQDSLSTNDPAAFPKFGTVCALLNKLVTSRFPNALAPIVSAHAQASIPLHLGQKVLKQLAQALMRERA